MKDFEYRFDIWLQVYKSGISVKGLLWVLPSYVDPNTAKKFIEGDIYALNEGSLEKISEYLLRKNNPSELFYKAVEATIPMYNTLKNYPEYEVFILNHGLLIGTSGLRKIINGEYCWGGIS